MARNLPPLFCLAFLATALLGGCRAVDNATGANNANVGQSLEEREGKLTRKQLSLRLRRLAMSYLGDVPEVCEKIAASDLPLELRLRALTIRANSADSVITIAADPDPQVALLNMVTVLTLQRIVAEEDAEASFGDLGVDLINATRRMETEVWRLAAMVLDPDEMKQLRGLIVRYRLDNPEETYVWWVRFGEFSGYKESFSIADIGRGVVDLFIPVGDAVAGIESTSDVVERAAWLASRQALLVQWRAEMVYLKAFSNVETGDLLESVQSIASTIDKLPKDIAKEREALMEIIEDQNSAVNRLLAQARSIVEEVNKAAEQAGKITEGVNGVIAQTDKTVSNIDQTIKQAEKSIENAKSILPETESALAQLESSSESLGQTIEILDQFVKQFEPAEDDPQAKPFDINEYTLAAIELNKTASELNALVTNLDQTIPKERIDETLGAARGQFSVLIWQGGFTLLGVGLILVLAAKWVPRRGN